MGEEAGEKYSFLVMGGLLEGNSSSRRKVTAAAGRGRILVRRLYCLRCALEAWKWRLSFLGNRKKSRKSLKDFLLRGGAGGRLVFSFESSGQGDPMMGYFTTQNSYLKSKRTLS